MSIVGTISLVVLSTLLVSCQTSRAAKVVEFGPKLSEFIEQYPGKSWLIKFYDPRCYYCQQLEPTYINVAEKVSHKHDNLIVGKVDCTQSYPTCSQFKISSYPTILLIKRDSNITYNGPRSLESLVSFTERFLGPDVLEVRDCEHLQEVVKDKGVIVLSTIYSNNKNDATAEAFETLAKLHKTSWWFYRIRTTCRNLVSTSAIYILKLHLKKPIMFKPDEQALDAEGSTFNAMSRWLEKESFPVYAPISHRNLKAVLETKKLIVIAVLDEYRPARKFSQPSNEFSEKFKKFAIMSAQRDGEDLLFGWSAELDLVQSVVIGEISVPNVMLLQADLSYRLLIEDFDATNNRTNLPPQLTQASVRKFIEAAKKRKLQFYGGNSYYYQLQRFIFGKYMKLRRMFKSDPLLAAVLIISPLLIMTFVIWNTCFDVQHAEGGESDDTDSDYRSELGDEELNSKNGEGQNLPKQHRNKHNHKKQD